MLPLRSLSSALSGIFTSPRYRFNLRSMKSTRQKSRTKRSAIKLEGQLLIAMPAMSDRRFQRSVIYVCAHSPEGAMGLIINQRANHISAPDLLERLGISARNPDDEITSDVLSLSIQVGGPVETGRGFVLHSSDYSPRINACHRAGRLPDGHDRYSEGDRAGPRSNASRAGTRLCGLVTGTARTEIQSNGWLHCPADPDLIFDEDLENKYSRALGKMGIDLSHLVSDAGHA